MIGYLRILNRCSLMRSTSYKAIHGHFGGKTSYSISGYMLEISYVQVARKLGCEVIFFRILVYLTSTVYSYYWIIYHIQLIRKLMHNQKSLSHEEEISKINKYRVFFPMDRITEKWEIYLFIFKIFFQVRTQNKGYYVTWRFWKC